MEVSISIVPLVFACPLKAASNKEESSTNLLAVISEKWI
jgi:hypothetical protein